MPISSTKPAPPINRREADSLLPGPDGAAGPGTISPAIRHLGTATPDFAAPQDEAPGVAVPGVHLSVVGSTYLGTREAEEKVRLCAQFIELTADGSLSGNQAAAMLGKKASWFTLNVKKYRREGLAAFLPEPRGPSASEIFPDLPAWFLPAARFFYLLTNHERYGGSVPEAIRRAIALPYCPPAVSSLLKKRLALPTLPVCPPELREAILLRQKEGKALLPETIARQIPCGERSVRQRRNPKDADLQYNSASGTMMYMNHPETGEREFIRPGQVFEMDDATINFPVCVPWPTGGCPCSEEFGAKAGRFQFIPVMDVASRFIVAFSYTARPKSSYRGEDILSVMRGAGRQWGIPEVWRLEQGVFASNLVKNAIATMGARHWGVHSPHNKLIEIFFNSLWTKLSVHFPDADVGRIRGDTQDAPKILTACQAGQRDPRKHFPMLAEVLEAFRVSIAEYNATPIHSANYGTWVPAERWEKRIELKKLNPSTDWIFSPCVREWKIKGGSVGGMVPIMDGVSVPYDFKAAWMSRFEGARVKAYFAPFDPKCHATICLAQRWGQQRNGENLGRAVQQNENTQQIRWAMGWGDDDRTVGKKLRSQAQVAVRREVRGILGRPESQGVAALRPPVFSESKERDGLGREVTISSGDCIPPEVSPDTRAYTDAASQECGYNSRGAHPAPNISNPPLRTGANPGRGTISAEEADRFEAENAHLF